MSAWKKSLWRWSWLLTLPISIMFLCWGLRTADRYATFGVRYDSTPIKYGLFETGKMEFRHLVRQIKLAGTTRKESGCGLTKELRMINLFIPEANLAQLNANLPHSGFHYVKGGLWNGKRLNKVKIRYRGDFIWHWGYYKKSLRIKTKKKSLFEGMRTFNLIAPKLREQLNTYLGYKLAYKMRLLAPRSEMVNVSINGKLVGVHVLVEQLGEMVLRKQGRMPGDLYAGELMGKDAYRGLSNDVFLSPGSWKKIAINNHYPEKSKKPLERLLKLINAKPTEARHRELSTLLDMDAWGRFSAFETLAQTFHYDWAHNWRLYYDPWRSCFVPVVWDPMAWHAYWLPKAGETAYLDIILTRLHKALFSNGEFLRCRQKAIEEFFASGLKNDFSQEVEITIAAVGEAIKQDPNILGGIGGGDPAQISAAMQKMKNNIERVLGDIERAYLESDSEQSYVRLNSNGVMAISQSGRRLIKRVVLKFIKPLSGPVSVHLRYWQNGQVIEKDISGAASLMGGNQLEISVPLMSRFVPVVVGEDSLKKNRIKVQPAYYEFRLTGVDPENHLFDVLVSLGGGTLKSAKEVSHLERRVFNDIYLIAKNQPLAVPLIWQGIVVIEGVQKIEKELIIEAGTTIRLKPGATLIFHNKLLAKGTKENPIRFVPADAGQDAWGAVVLKGKKARGALFSHCEFVGGSGLKGDLFEYTAMLSIHDVKGVNVKNCTFRDSKITDDMVHAVYSEVRFNDCRFEHSLMDALDIDISDTVIEGCYFSDSGNDSIDLMTSTAVVVDTLIENSGDKAASVGEGSYLLAINNVLRGNLIGVQAKDGSVASLYNLDLIANEHALDAYKKNWRYNDGGKIYLHKSRLMGNKKQITADKKSAIRVYDSYIDKPIKVMKKRLKLAKTVDSESEKKARSQKLKRSKKEIELMKEFDPKYWNRIDIGRRGASNVASH